MTMPSQSFAQWIEERLAQTERALEQALPDPAVNPTVLHRGMRYAVLDGGKRIRPLLSYAACEFVGGNAEVAAIAGSAVEMIHAYSLVHDDMPCMDNDVLRRGKPTVHVAFGEANAMLVGDSLQPLAFQTIAQLGTSLPSGHVVQMVQMLAHASGSLGMAGGQAIDLSMVGKGEKSLNTGDNITQAQLEQMHRLKTGALLRCAVITGAWCKTDEPSAHQINALNIYSAAMGLAFQVVDDILDVTADTTTLGKTAGKDQQDNKPTYVSLLGMTAAKQLAHELHQQAVDAVKKVDQKADKEAEQEKSNRLGSLRLCEIADLIVSRRS
jgi:farnesyl diphosphate synthase